MNFVRDFVLCAIVFALSLWVYYPTLEHQPSYDDFYAVIDNADVRTDKTSLMDVLQHDFWGTDINAKGSNTQYRPITILSYRFDYKYGCLAPWKHKQDLINHKKTAATRKKRDVQDLDDDTLEDIPPLSHIVEEVKNDNLKDLFPSTTLSANDDDATVLRKMAVRAIDSLGKNNNAPKEDMKKNNKEFVFDGESKCLKQFRWTDILLHAIASVLVYIISRTIADMSWVPAFGAASMFAVHPIHIESVAMLYGRADVLCSVIQMVALLLAHAAACLMSNRIINNSDDDTKPTSDLTSSPVAFLLCFISFVLAIASALAKEIGIISMIMIPLVFWLKTARTAASHSTLKKKCPSLQYPPVLLSTCGLSFALLFVSLRHNLIHSWTPPISWFDNPQSLLPTSFLSKALSIGHLHSRYLLWLFYPILHSPNYGFNAIPIVESITDIRNIGTVAAYLAVFGTLLIVTIKRAWIPLLLVCWGGGAFLPSSDIFFPVGTAFADRLLYVPSIPFCILLAWIASTIISSFVATESNKKDERESSDEEDEEKDQEKKNTKETQKRQEDALKREIGLALIGLLIAGGSFMITTRIPEWRDSITVWRSVVRQMPDNVLGHNNFAVELMKYGLVEEYLHELNEIERIYSSSANEKVLNHTLRHNVLSVRNQTIALIMEINEMERMSASEAVQTTNDIISAITSNQTMEIVNRGFIRFSALAISGTFKDHPELEDIVMDSLSKVASVQGKTEDVRALMKNVVLQRRLKLHGSRSAEKLQSLIERMKDL